MRTRINLNLKRLISICIALALLLSTIGISGTIAHAAENDFDEVVLALSSNVVNDDTIDLYLLDEEYYISIDDLCRLTRSTKSVDGDVISVTQGIWRAEFDIANQTFNDGYQMADIAVLEISNGDYAVPALMFLSYYKAMAIIKNDVLYCELPQCTAWEALDLDYSNSLVDIYELYGGEGNVELSLTLDILMDFIMGKNPTTEKYLKSAYYEALDVDIYSYGAVEQYVNERNEAVYNDLVAEETQSLLESLSNICGAGDSTNKITQEAMDLYILFHCTGQTRDFYNLAYNAMEIGDTTSVRHYTDQIASVWQEGEFQKSLVKNNAKSVEGAFFLLSSAVEAAQQVKYTHQENNLVYRVMGQENMNKLSLDVGDNEWYSVANVYKSTATSLQNSFVNILGDLQTVAINDLVSEAAGKIGVDTFMESAASKVTGIKGIKSASWKIGLEVGRGAVNLFSWIDSLAEPDSLVDILFTDIGAYEADRLALYLSELQQNVWWVLCNERERMHNNPDDITAYQDYIYAQQLYCRTSIAMYENLMAMNDEFGSDKDYWRSLFQARIDMLAVCLYQLTTLQDDGVSACLPLYLETFKYNMNTENGDISNIPADAKKITLSRDEQYRINIFLSNFAEQSFCEYWDCEKFETQSASIGELISFVFWHSWANNETKLRSRQDSSGKIYLTIDEINKDVERFFDRTVTLDDAISSGYHVEGDCVYGHFGSYGPYNYMSVADAMWQRADGTCIVDFSVYQVNDRYDVGSGLIGDKGVYYLTSEEAAADTGVLYYKSGVAEVKPHLNNGKDSYQLISYQLKPNGKSVVSDAYCDVLQIDDFLKPFSCYHIPKVTIPGVNTTTANTEIFNELHSEMRENVYDDPSNPVYTSMTYMWSESKHVVSVRVLISHSYTDWIADYTYNFSKETGALLSNQELLNILGITEKRYLELLETAVKKEIFDFCQQFQSHSPANDEIEWILAENRETCSIDATSLCVDANGNLGCMVNIPWTNCNMRMVAATGDGMLYFPNVSCNQKGKHTIVIPTIQEDHSTDTSTSDKDAVANEDDEAEKLPYSSLTGAFEFNGHYYKVFLDSSISWHAAKAKCEQMGGYLVCISDEQEDAFVFSLAQQSRVQCWMGGSDEEEEGVWKWVTGEEWIYDNGFYDNRNGKQHYLVMNYSGMNTWDDQSEIDDSFLCQVSGYICEWDKK